MTGRPDDRRLHDWLDATVGQVPDAVTGTRQVMSMVEETPQVGRWRLPWKVHRGTVPRTPAIADTTEFQAQHPSATNGHLPISDRRNASMFSPGQAISVGALVLALGGVLFWAQPSGRLGGGAPAAEAEPIKPTWITGQINHAPGCQRPGSVQDDTVRHEWDIVCEPQTWVSSDPRFSGSASAWWSEDIHQTDEGPITVATAAYYLKNDDGGWTCQYQSLYAEVVTGDTVPCVGEGGYLGLSALLFIQPDPSRAYGETFAGIIFSGDVPPVPGPSTPE